MRARDLLVPLAVIAAGCAAVPPSHTGLREPFDHYNPVQLNELAVAAAQSGKLDDAWILLERAALLAPHDERIARNLAAVRAYRKGQRFEAPGPASPQGEGAIAPVGTAAEPPPIWPAR